jgi:ubiquitin carboxyl-terminal hydrolase 8
MVRATKHYNLTRFEYLIIHLKRFKQKGYYKDKITSFISNPITDLDLSKFGLEYQAHFFDLYGVINHYGTLRGEHYTPT